MRRSLRIASALPLVLAAAAFAGSAFAGGGNSANAPGQQKQDAAPAQSSAPQSSMPPGQAKKASSNTAQSSTAPGVKPSNTTSHGVTCTTTSSGCDNGSGHSPADASKRYGNGKTAAQIATSRGAPAGTPIYGPGNSQPHKVSTCGHPAHGNGGGVDVHAVKSYSTAACRQSTPQTQAVQQHAVQQQGVEVQKTVVVQKTVAVQQHSSPATAVVAAPVAKPAGTGAVLGAQATLAKPAAHLPAAHVPAAHHGVLGALGSVAGASLPFTGFPVWVAVLIGLALLATGLVLHRRAALGAR